MLEKFPFGDSLLKDLEIINPESVNTYSFPTVLSLAKRFPQIGLSESSKLDKLWEEFMDFDYHQSTILPYNSINLTSLRDHEQDCSGGTLATGKYSIF